MKFETEDQGLKSIGNAGTAFPGRQTSDRKEGAFPMKKQEHKWYLLHKRVNILDFIEA